MAAAASEHHMFTDLRSPAKRKQPGTITM